MLCDLEHLRKQKFQSVEAAYDYLIYMSQGRCKQINMGDKPHFAVWIDNTQLLLHLTEHHFLWRSWYKVVS